MSRLERLIQKRSFKLACAVLAGAFAASAATGNPYQRSARPSSRLQGGAVLCAPVGKFRGDHEGRARCGPGFQMQLTTPFSDTGNMHFAVFMSFYQFGILGKLYNPSTDFEGRWQVLGAGGRLKYFFGRDEMMMGGYLVADLGVAQTYWELEASTYGESFTEQTMLQPALMFGLGIGFEGPFLSAEICYRHVHNTNDHLELLWAPNSEIFDFDYNSHWIEFGIEYVFDI